jgi:predicted dehydrogenase
MQPVRFVVIGLGGYGLVHIKAVRWLARQNQGRLVGVVALPSDRNARPQLAAELESEGVVLYSSTEEFFARGVDTTDVLTVPIGIHQHVPVAIRALEAGLHVYCEKPVAATVQEVDRLIEAEARSGRKVAIGFQHLGSVSMQRLKEVLTAGRLGTVRAISLMCGWPRSVQYFQRNEWAGRLRVGDDWILDSPANNAHAHYVMNALYLASPQRDEAASPQSVRAELWRAHNIESADTVQCHIETAGGVQVWILVTHAGGYANGPAMHVICDNGRIYWLTDEGRTTVRYADGGHESYDNCSHALWRYDGFKNFVDAINGRATVVCTPAIARAQTLAVNLMHESCRSIVTVPGAFVTEQEDWEMFPADTRGRFRRITGMDAAMHVAFHEAAFLSELGLEWTAGMESRTVSGAGYLKYPAGQ